MKLFHVYTPPPVETDKRIHGYCVHYDEAFFAKIQKLKYYFKT